MLTWTMMLGAVVRRATARPGAATQASLVLLAALVTAGRASVAGAALAAPAVPSVARGAADAAAPSPPATLREIIDRAAESVVALKVERSKDLARPPSPLGPTPAVTKEAQAYYSRPEGWVSGVIVDREGHVVTSWYNVGGDVTSIQVQVPSGRTYPAKLVAKSVLDDVALLRIDRKEGDPEIPFREPLWADATGLRAGTVIFALGRSPDPLRITVTRGILSAVARNGGRAVQTDAELNYGNVGGPMVDLEGRIVALSAFVGHTRPMWGINSGVGFGTTATSVIAMLPTLKEGKDYTAFRFPFLGVRGDLNHVSPPGARVEWIAPGGPAEKAGFKAGDIIVQYEGTAVVSFDQLRKLIFRSVIGEKVKVKVRRGEESLDLEPVLQEMPES